MFPVGPVDRSGGCWLSAFRGGKYVMEAALPPPSSWPGNGSGEPPGKTSRQSGRARARRERETEEDRRGRRPLPDLRQVLKDSRKKASARGCVCVFARAFPHPSKKVKGCVCLQKDQRAECVCGCASGSQRNTIPSWSPVCVCVCVWLRTVASRGQGEFRAGVGVGGHP